VRRPFFFFLALSSFRESQKKEGECVVVYQLLLLSPFLSPTFFPRFSPPT